MPIMAPTTAAPTTIASSLIRRIPVVQTLAPPSPAARPSRLSSANKKRSTVRSAAITTAEVPSSSSSASASDEEKETAAKLAGARVRVTSPVRVYHVTKAPDLDLCGMEGVVKQFVGVWKGKRISANFPFKVEFFISVDGQPSPVKFFAHLRDDEFEFIDSSD